MSKKADLPLHFKHPLFFKEQREIKWEKATFGLECDQSYFLHDILYAVGEEHEQPWKDVKKYLPQVFAKWNEAQSRLYKLFSERKAKEAQPLMIKAIAYFISALFWTNHEPVPRLTHLQQDIEKLKYKPINVYERLAFIIEKPGMYHSFIQVGELYTELRKQYAKMLIVYKK
ncbi:hypothetical protein FZC66_12435 [Priestia megaterium]|nr:hypothetical protein FZC66_12435 [Priestia megaterium]